MDLRTAAAARALVLGDPLRALKEVALRDDPTSLALRGIAMAQLEDYPCARQLLRRAGRNFGARDALARARCMVAEAEVALAMRELSSLPRSFASATATLEAHGDHANALHARVITVRRLLLLGRLTEAQAALACVQDEDLPPALSAVAELANAELALRALRADAAHVALSRAADAAARAQVPALVAEVVQARAALQRPAARCLFSGGTRALRVDEVASLLTSETLVVDACHHVVRSADKCVSLARRPVLFALLRALAQAWPRDVDRDELIACAFKFREPDETHRVRLRVQISRLRALLAPMAQIIATARGFVLKPDADRNVAVLAPPIDGHQESLLALLSDGAAWSTSALALAMGTKQRNVQRALVALHSAGRVRSIGHARARRWLAPPLTGFTTILLLPNLAATQ